MKKLLLLFTALLTVLIACSQSKVDSLLRLCDKATEKQKSALYLEISFDTRTDSSISNLYSRKAYRLAVKNNQIPEQAKAFYYLGETAYYLPDYFGAIPAYEKAMPLFKELKDTLNIFNCYNSIGLCYYFMNQGEKAIVQFINGLKLCDTDIEKCADLLSNIAMVHNKMRNHQEAIVNYRKALTKNIIIRDSSSIGVDYNGLGEVFSSMDRWDSASVNYFKALHIYKKLKNIGRQSIILTNLGYIYKNFPDSLNKALSYFNQASNGFKKAGMQQFEAEVKSGIGSIYFKKAKYTDAIKMFEKSLELNVKYLQGLLMKKINYKGLSDTYEKTGDYKSAFKYSVLYAQYSDSLNQKEKYEQIVTLEKQYDTKKKEGEILQLHAKQELTNVQLKKNKQLILLGFIMALLFLMLVFFISKKYLEKNKSNLLLEEKNKQIEQSEQELSLLNAAKNKLFSIIAHDLKNPIHTIMGYSYLLSQSYEKYSEKERRKFSVDIYQSTNNIFRLLENLLEWSKSQTGRLNFTPIETEFCRILENSISILRPMASLKKIELTATCIGNVKVFADPFMIETILRNLINNAIKFTPNNGFIHIAVERIENMVKISIRDSGIGISDDDLKNLFQIDSTVKRKGTNNEDGSGLGLILCNEFISKNNGKLWVESTLGKGSTFYCTIPIQDQ